MKSVQIRLKVILAFSEPKNSIAPNFKPEIMIWLADYVGNCKHLHKHKKPFFEETLQEGSLLKVSVN